MKGVQYFDPKKVDQSMKLSPDEVLQFLENYRKLIFQPKPMKLISIRLPEPLIERYKAEAKRLGIPYQRLMKERLEKGIAP